MNNVRLPRCIGIPLLGKGATTHLHRKTLIEAFRREGWEICFLVREDYLPVIDTFPNCKYEKFIVPRKINGKVNKILIYCQQLRRIFPCRDLYKHWQYETLLNQNGSYWGRTHLRFQYTLARFVSVMNWVIRIEGWLYRKLIPKSMDEFKFDHVLMLGVGSPVDGLSLPLSWWAINRKIPLSNFVGNYDSLSSNGFRGHPIQNVLVWSQNMRNDALKLQYIPDERIKIIGSIRYNELEYKEKQSRNEFFLQRGLDPSAKTITFAGFYYEYHYFEMISAFKEMKKKIATASIDYKNLS